MNDKLVTLLNKSKRYINPFTIAGAVFVGWMIASRSGYLSNSQLHEDEDGQTAPAPWNVKQAFLVAVLVISSHYVLQKSHLKAIVLSNGGGSDQQGFQLPEGASILMPNQVSTSGAPGTIPTMLTGPAPF